MVYKRGSLKGQLTTAEIRKLVSAHNKLSKITIPPKSTRDAIMSIIVKAGFRVNHGDQKLEQVRATKKDISLEKAKETTKRLPKTEEQKQKSTAQKEQKKAEKDKELKLAKKEGVKEFQAKKAEAQKKKPVPKPPAVKKKTSTMGTQTGEAVKKPQKTKEESKKIEPKKKEDNITQLKGFKVLEKVYTKYYGERIKLREKYLKGGFKKEMDWEMADDEIDGEMHSEWSTLSMPQDDVKFLFIKSPYNDKSHPLQKVDNMLEERVKNYKIWRELMKQEPKKKPQKTIEEPQKTKEETKKILKKAFPFINQINSLKAFPGMFHFNFNIGLREKRNIEMKDISEKIKEVKSKIPKDILDRLVISFNSGYSDNNSQLRYNFGNDKLIETNRSKK